MKIFGGGEHLKKSDHKRNDSLSGELDKNFDMMDIACLQGDGSIDRGSRKTSRIERRNKAPDLEKDEDEYKEKEPTGRKNCTTGRSLDRVVSRTRDDGSRSTHDSVQSGGGQSYSDKIMKTQQQRSKRN